MALKDDVQELADALTNLANDANSLVFAQGIGAVTARIRALGQTAERLARIIPTPTDAKAMEGIRYNQMLKLAADLVGGPVDYIEGDDGSTEYDDAPLTATPRPHSYVQGIRDLLHTAYPEAHSDTAPAWLRSDRTDEAAEIRASVASVLAANWHLPCGATTGRHDRNGNALRVGDPVRVHGSDRYGNPRGRVCGPGPDIGDDKQRVHVEIDQNTEYTPSTGRVELLPESNGAQGREMAPGYVRSVLIELTPNGLRVSPAATGADRSEAA